MIAKCSVTSKNMSMQLQSTSTVLSESLEKIEPLTAIKNENIEYEIGIDDIPNSLDEEIIPDVKEINIVSHELSEDLIKSETVFENTFENNHSGSVEAQIFVKTEKIPLIKTENLTQNEYLYKTPNTSDGNVSRGTRQRVIEVQEKEGSNEHFNILQSDKQFLNFFKDLSDVSRKAKFPNKTYFSECYKTVETTSCKKDKKKEKVIEVPVIQYCCEKCTFMSKNRSYFKRHKLSHKTKAEVDGQYQYRCDKCKYKTCRSDHFKRHKLMHLKPKQILYFYCYHCPYKCKQKNNLQRHIFLHFKNEDVPFHCYICDFTTLKRNLIIEHFKKHPKHHSKCDEIDYKNQLEIYTKKPMRYYNYCKKCLFRTYHYESFELHKLTHITEAKMDDRHFKYHCDKCKYKTFRHTDFKRHKLSHLKPEEIHYFYCYHCSYKSKHKVHLKTHIFRHFKNENVPFNCYICDFTTLKRNLIIEHFKKHPKHHSKCDETYTKKQMRYNKTEAEMDDRDFKYRCDKCKYKTFRHHDFKTHKLIHLKPEEIQYFYCYHCSLKSKQKINLKTHIFRHFEKGEIPFHCYICDFVTLKRDLIIEHFKTHPKHHSIYDETEYKYQLETCNKRYCCEKCTYTSGTSSNFKLHQLTHKTKADDRLLKYRCDKCKYKTFRSDTFKAHKLTHLKPEEIQYFYCYHCSYKSNRKQTLKRHIFKHFKYEEIPFQCYICDFVTLKRESFKKHLKHNKYDEDVRF